MLGIVVRVPAPDIRDVSTSSTRTRHAIGYSCYRAISYSHHKRSRYAGVALPYLTLFARRGGPLAVVAVGPNPLGLADYLPPDMLSLLFSIKLHFVEHFPMPLFSKGAN